MTDELRPELEELLQRRAAMSDEGRTEAERGAMFQAIVAEAYERGKALNLASHFEIDDVIDPAETRSTIAELLRAAPPPGPRMGKETSARRPVVKSA